MSKNPNPDFAVPPLALGGLGAATGACVAVVLTGLPTAYIGALAGLMLGVAMEQD